ncbi:ATP-binding protein [Rheinheimera gaetbuli]
MWQCFAQADPLIQRLGNEDGLTNNTLYDLVQDDAGYIWLATTESGLKRYDGYRFVTFSVLEPQEALSSIQPDVGKLLIDSKQQLWVGTWGLGVSRLSPDRSTLSRFALGGLKVQSLLETADGSVWVGSTNGLFRITPDDRVERIGGPDASVSFLHQRVWSLAQGDDDTVWIGTSEGFYAWQPTTGLSAPVLLTTTATSGSRANEIRALAYFDAKLWLGTRNGLSAFNPDNGQLNHLQSGDGSNVNNEFVINTLKPDISGNLLIGSYEGLHRYSPACGCFMPFRQQQALLPTLNVRAIFTDRSGVLWLGTRSHGLFYTRYGQNAFSLLQHSAAADLRKNFAFSVTNLLFTEHNRLSVSVGQHLHQLNLSTDSATHLKLESTINKLAIDENDVLYIATDQGVFFQHPAEQTLKPFNTAFELAKITEPIVRDMVTQAGQRFWFGLWGNGVLYYDKQRGVVRHFLSELSSHHSGDAVEAMTLMADGTVWVGTRYSGLYQLDAEAGITNRLQQGFATALPSDKIQCLENDGASLLLICTNRGLVLWDLASDIKRFLDQRDGLASSNIVGAVAEQSRIWVMTSQGINLISPDIDHIVTFSQHDGLTAPELNSNANAIDADGNLYFGTLQGVFKANPKLIWTNSTKPIPRITAVKVNHEPALALEPYAKTPLILSPTENTLEFHFSAMDYHDVDRNSYRYKLIGLDNDWVYAGTRPYTVYANLAPGDYQLQLMAMNNNGLISEQTANLTFVISPRWWQLWQVQSGFVLIFVALLLALHLYRMRHIRQINRLLNQAVSEKSANQRLLEETVNIRTQELQKKTAQLEQSLEHLAEKNQELTRLDKLKDQFVSTVSHELRTPLTAIRGAISLISKQAVKPDSAAYNKMLDIAGLNSERLAQLISDLLDMQKFDSGHFQLEPVRFDLNTLTKDAIEAIQPYAEHFDVQIRWQDNSEPYWLKADPLRIRQVMDNFLSNAIKFSNARQQVTVSLQRQQDAVLWQVTDSGRGISPEFAKSIFSSFSQEDASNARNREGTGLGLAISKKIIDSHAGRIGFSSTLGQGSRFWFSLPAAH